MTSEHRKSMKPAAFEYSRPADIDEACALLAADDGARVIAGGQTLVPLMAMRLARPSRLIDIARIPGLAYVRDEGKDIAIGATTRQHVVENDPVVRAKLPLLAKVMPYVGHAATRARGTVGGSLANGDSAAEIVLVAVTLGATLDLARGRQEQFHRGVGFLPRADGDGAAADRLPRGSALPGVAGDAGWRWLPRDQRAAERFRLRVGRGADRARRRRPLHPRGHRHRRGDRRAAAARRGGAGAARPAFRRRARCASAVKAALADIEAMADLHASAEYRKRVAATLAVRAIADAYHRRREAVMKVELDINREKHTVDVEPRTSLLDCLRDKLLLTGAHAGCEHGVCGACTVLVDGAAVRSCLMFAVQADGYAITTIEGLSPGPGELSPIQDAFCETHGMQCGYCTPAMILAAHALLVEKSAADARGDRRRHLRQHLPLHRLCADRRGDCARRRTDARRRTIQAERP